MGNLAQNAVDSQDALKPALEFYNEGLEIEKRLLTEYPDNVDLNYLTYDLLLHIGDIQIDEKDRTAAARSYNEALTRLRKLVRLQPNNVDFKKDMVSILTRAAQLAQDSQERNALVHEALDTFEALKTSGDLPEEWAQMRPRLEALLVP